MGKNDEVVVVEIVDSYMRRRVFGDGEEGGLMVQGVYLLISVVCYLLIIPNGPFSPTSPSILHLPLPQAASR